MEMSSAARFLAVRSLRRYGRFEAVVRHLSG
jgi:hypothetical protein